MDLLTGIDFGQIAKNARLAEDLRSEAYQRLRDADNYRPMIAAARGNAKLRKSQIESYRLVSLSLAKNLDSGHQVCEQASAECSALCVGSDGVGKAQVFDFIKAQRIMKTKRLFEHRTETLMVIIGEIEREVRAANRNGEIVVCRLNTFSDLAWEEPEFGCLPQLFPEVVNYDYTKRHFRVKRLKEWGIENYHLCGSWSELKRHQAACKDLLESGYNVAVPFSSPGLHAGNKALRQDIPKRFNLFGDHFYDCVDGDSNDMRFLDPGATRSGRGRLICLRLKAGSNSGRERGMKENGFSIVLGGAS
jgi:hypothetical protein